MKKLAILIVALALPVLSWGQDYNSDMVQADSVVYRQAAAMDSTLVGKSIFGQSIVNAMKLQIASNSSRKLTGYRVRIFFDNSKTARNASENVMKIFKATYPGIPAYRNYQNPFFRVVVGDFRTKSEAMEFLQKIKSSYTSALVVKEGINFPAVNKEHNYVTDTVTVYRPVANL